MYGTPSDDWLALTQNYRSMSDDKLRELADAFTDLTPTAQQVLRDEMKLRKLGDPLTPGWWRAGAEYAPEPDNLDALAGADSAAAVEYTWKTPLCPCESREQAWQISEVLKRAGIESWIDKPSLYDPHASVDDPVGPRVLVAADQLDEARASIAQPIPAEIVELSMLEVPEYELPVCPRCGAAEPILESVEPVNTWKCEVCGAEWADEQPEPDSEG